MTPPLAIALGLALSPMLLVAMPYIVWIVAVWAALLEGWP